MHFTKEAQMKAKTFQDRMKHRSSGSRTEMGEGKESKRMERSEHCGCSAGEYKMGLSKMRSGLTAQNSTYSQSRDGNGGKR